MVAVYIDAAGDARSRGSDRIVAYAGTTPREARVRAALWAATADALDAAGPTTAPTPITAAPSYPKTLPSSRPVAVIDVAQMQAETAAALATYYEKGSPCR